MSLFVDCHTHMQYNAPEAVISLYACIISETSIQNQICSVGIHPMYMTGNYKMLLDQLKASARDQYVLAIGECGLDKRSPTPWEQQLTALEDQIDVAISVNKPVILHTVRAYQETINIIQHKQSVSAFIFHGFNKHAQLGLSLVDKGYYLSLGTAILKGHMDELILKIPLEAVFLETDDQNVSIIEIYTYFCAVRKINIETLKQQLYTNFCTVFNYSK